MDILAPLIAYSIALGIAAVIPGPGIAALVGNALGGDLKASMFFLAGLALGDVAYLTVAVVGLAALAQSFAGALIILKLLGGGYLLYLAYKIFTSDAGITNVKAKKETSYFASFLTGLVITVSNPKTVIFYLALLPTVIDLQAVDFTQWAALSALTVVILFAGLSPYAILAAKARQMLTQPKALKRLNKVAGTTISGAGAYIFGEGVVALLRRT